jgi:ferritin-like protein
VSGELAVALAAEEAAIYAYGILGVHLGGDGDKTEARADEQAHRARRDAVMMAMVAAGVPPGPAPAAYELPFAVRDAAAALKLAIHVEDGVAQAWRPVLAVSAGADRTTALSAMTDAAVRATRWRRLAKITPITLAFPGRAG